MKSTVSCKGAPISLLRAAAFAATPVRPRKNLYGAWQLRPDCGGVGGQEPWFASGADNWITPRVSDAENRLGGSPDKQIPRQPTGPLNHIGNPGGVYGPVELDAAGRAWIDVAARTP
jgi:hypothetical protein